MSSIQYNLASPIEFLTRLFDRRINDSVGFNEETADDVQRRYLFMEFISSETEYLEMLKLFEHTYLAVLNKSDHVAWQMTFRVVQQLVKGHEKVLQQVFHWLELPILIDDSKAEINWEQHAYHIGNKFQSLDYLSSFIQVYVEKLLELEPHYKDYVYHYSLCNTFKKQGIFNAKLMKQLYQMEPMLKKFQQQRLNSQSTDLFRRNISFESLRHLPIARLGHYKVFFDSFLKSTKSLILQKDAMRSTRDQNIVLTGKLQGKPISSPKEVGTLASLGEEFLLTEDWELFASCVLLVQSMLLRIDGVNFSNLVDKPAQRIAAKLSFKHQEEYVPVSALGVPQLTGILNTVWVEISEGQKLWNNTVGSIDNWRRKRILYPIFQPKGKQFGAFLYKSYLILARIPMIPMSELQTGNNDGKWTIKFAIPLTNCKLTTVDEEFSRYNEIGLKKQKASKIDLFKLEWFLYGDVFETFFVFDNTYECDQWSQALRTMIDLNGFTSKPMEAESVENYYRMGNSTYAPIGIAPKLTFADAVSKTLNLNLTRRQYSLINHPMQDYYYYTSFKLNIGFNGLKTGPTNEKNAIVFARDKFSLLERQVFALQHPFDTLQNSVKSDSPSDISNLGDSYSNPKPDSVPIADVSLVATTQTTRSYASSLKSSRSYASLRRKCSNVKVLFKAKNC
ncbi:unnamed protein product [Kluyveromyces dobzhanskii CBS 2104]|uniref:WGS project CCBQ000000000 data, contig 00058 n=1 Tax=Kluyveromyces dobzhanskii CBS 2104 TaxID=1427455 RepID=A0A0A8LDG5_9SACH|nr:unnamed protein product [Kluyveromyces dobzhanskii CBS 2104]